MVPREAGRVATIFRDAFNDLYERRGFGPIVADESVGRVIAETYLVHDPDHCLVVEYDGRLAGSAFLHPRATVAGIGPVTVDPSLHGRGLGRALVGGLCERADRLGIASTRLIQDAFNENSYALYARLGFRPQRVLARASFLPGRGPAVRETRVAAAADLANIAALEEDLLGFSRRRDYELLRRVGEVLVLDGRGGIEGWAGRIVRGSVAVLGPVLSRSFEGMRRLVDEGSSELPAGTEIRILLPAESPEVLEFLAPRELEVHSLCNYMVRGSFSGIRGHYVPTLFPESG